MSATILSEIVGLDELISRPVNIEREDSDVQRLIPWIFQHDEIADEDNMIDSSKRPQFSTFFDELFPYYDELEAEEIVVKEYESCDAGIASALKQSENITLPRKSWKVSQSEYSRQFTNLQRTMLRELMRTIYNNLEDMKDIRFHFPIATSKLKYVIGGEQFVTRTEGGVTIGPSNKPVPIISYTTWFKDQTWSEFLEETLSVMLGQLAKNINISPKSDASVLQDQEVFVIGFYKLSIHIARGFFTGDTISRVHSKGYSENEVFELKFTRGHNLFLKKDWLEATRAFARLFRYLQSGDAKVGAIQALFTKET